MLKMIILFMAFGFPDNAGIIHLRFLYGESFKDEDKANQLLSVSSSYSSSNVTYLGYKGAAKNILSKHAFNPYTKLKLFREGSRILEDAISADTNNIELRYLRLTIQENAPRLLGYCGMIDRDKYFLECRIERMSDKHLQNIISKYLSLK